MLSRLVCFAAVIIYVAAADSGAAACSLDLVWPPPDAIILIGTDSEMIPAYLKLAGDCSEFFPLAAAGLLHFPAFTYRLIQREAMSSSVNDRAIWSYSYCWAEAAVAYFFTTSRWSVGSMEVMDLCELGLVGQLQTNMNSGIRFNCPEPQLHSTIQD